MPWKPIPLPPILRTQILLIVTHRQIPTLIQNQINRMTRGLDITDDAPHLLLAETELNPENDATILLVDLALLLARDITTVETKMVTAIDTALVEINEAYPRPHLFAAEVATMMSTADQGLLLPGHDETGR